MILRNAGALTSLTQKNSWWNPQKAKWIRGLIGSGFDGPEIICLAKCRGQGAANRKESELILDVFSEGDLLNGKISPFNRAMDGSSAKTFNTGICASFSTADLRLIDKAVAKTMSISRSHWMRCVMIDAAKRELAR
jgi:hypothetical protein